MDKSLKPVAVSSDRRTAILDPGREDERLVLVTLPPTEYVSPPIEASLLFGQAMVRFEPWPESVPLAPYLEVVARLGEPS